jgi:hypothetical protein
MTRDDITRQGEEPTEGSWIYVSGPMRASGFDDAEELSDRLAEVCEASGWQAYRPYTDARDAESPEAPLIPRLRHAVGHAEACVFNIGNPFPDVGTELAWAAEHRRPVIAVQMRGDQPSPLLTSLINEYDRAALLICNDPDDCAEKVRQTFHDPDWYEVVRAAGAELVEDLH